MYAIDQKWYFWLTETELQPSAEPQSVSSLEELKWFVTAMHTNFRVSKYVLKIPLTLLHTPKWMVHPTEN